MACCRSHRCNIPQPTANPCCCCQPSPSLPPPPQPCLSPLPATPDSILLQTVISQLLQNPHTHTFPEHPNITTPSTSSPIDNPHHLRQCLGQCQTPSASQLNHNKPTKQVRFPRQQHHHPPLHAVDQFDDPHYYTLLIASLRQRIETLELALHGLSPSPSRSLRDFAARTIQTHFRVYLVRRSRALHELKELASIKSHLNVLRSTLSIRKRGVDFGSVSRQATNLILRLESIEGEDQLVRDSKRSVSREIDQLLASIDDLFVKRQVIVSRVATVTKQTRKNNDDPSNLHPSRGVTVNKPRQDRKVDRKKSQNHELSNDEMKLVDSLRDRIDRINSMSEAIGREEGTSSRINHYVGRSRSGSDNRFEQQRKTNATVKNNNSFPIKTGKKRVGFLEDGNVTWVYDNEKQPLTMPYEEEEEEEEVENAEDDEHTTADFVNHEGSEEDEEDVEAPNDGGEEGSTTCSQASDDMVTDDHTRTSGKFVFSPPEPLKMEDRAGLAKKSAHGVRIIG